MTFHAVVFFDLSLLKPNLGQFEPINLTILRCVVWMSTVFVREQSEGSATQMPFLAKAWMVLWEPNQPDPILDPEARVQPDPTSPKNWVYSGVLSKFWCLNPNVDSFWSQTDPNQPNFEPWDPKLTKIKTKNGVNHFNLISKSYHFQGRCLNEHSFREGAVWRLGHTDALPGQGLDDTPMVEVMKVGVRIQNWQGQAVELCVGQRPNNVRFKAFHILKCCT